ncbi:MAG TPA: type II toxin-antitoxin system HicA family toxin [bacterium]|nr:type II toxin-antitoxin system HicA family toxin [bacterium]
MVFLSRRRTSTLLRLLYEESPDHTELDPGTLRAIIRQAGLSVDEFIRLLRS